MKIAHIVSTFPPYKGGMGNSAYHFVEILSQMGHEIVVFTPDYGKQKEDIIKEEKFKVVRLKSFLKIGNAAVLPQFLWNLGGFDIIHLHYPFYGAVGYIILRKLFFWQKTKLVVHYHMDTIASGPKGLVFKFNRIFILPFILRVAGIITCASLDYLRNSDAVGYYNKNKKKFKQVSFGVDANHFKVSDRKLAGRVGVKTVLFVGGLDKAHYFKGLDILMEAFKKALKGKNNAKLIIIGKGDLKKHYLKMAEDLGLKENIEIADNVNYEELPSFYQKADIFVLPSINKSEAFGIVLLEAMASGVPVITTNLPGVRSVLKNSKQGFIVQPNDADALADKISKLLNDEKLARRMGRAGRILIEKKYTWEEAGKNLDYIYHRLKYSPK
jgi:glycosyltransferase involved in cell wall biosynthesis